MKRKLMIRRTIMVLVTLVGLGALVHLSADIQRPVIPEPTGQVVNGTAITTLNQLEVKGRASKTGYSRDEFGGDWRVINGCDTRNIILKRDLVDAVVNDKCQVMSGTLNDPYTGKTIEFKRGGATSSAVQIDHVVALSNAWQTGAQQLTAETRDDLANDPLELLAVDGPANQQKSDGDAATWLPPNKSFRCQYVARQIAVKKKYSLWVTSGEKDAIAGILAACPSQNIP
jgi:hypothetical protein